MGWLRYLLSSKSVFGAGHVLPIKHYAKQAFRETYNYLLLRRERADFTDKLLRYHGQYDLKNVHETMITLLQVLMREAETLADMAENNVYIALRVIHEISKVDHALRQKNRPDQELSQIISQFYGRIVNIWDQSRRVERNWQNFKDITLMPEYFQKSGLRSAERHQRHEVNPIETLTANIIHEVNKKNFNRDELDRMLKEFNQHLKKEIGYLEVELKQCLTYEISLENTLEGIKKDLANIENKGYPPFLIIKYQASVVAIERTKQEHNEKIRRLLGQEAHELQAA